MAQRKSSDAGSAGSRAEAVRAAVDQAFQAGAAQGAAAAGQGRERAQDIVEQFVQAAGRFREVFEELRPPTGDELRALRRQVEALEKRVAALEEGAAEKTTAPRRRSTTAKSSTAKTAKSTTRSTTKSTAKSRGASTSKGAKRSS